MKLEFLLCFLTSRNMFDLSGHKFDLNILFSFNSIQTYVKGWFFILKPTTIQTLI